MKKGKKTIAFLCIAIILNSTCTNTYAQETMKESDIPVNSITIEEKSSVSTDSIPTANADNLGMQPTMSPDMQPTMSPGMQPTMSPGMQPTMSPEIRSSEGSEMDPMVSGDIQPTPVATNDEEIAEKQIPSSTPIVPMESGVPAEISDEKEINNTHEIDFESNGLIISILNIPEGVELRKNDVQDAEIIAEYFEKQYGFSIQIITTFDFELINQEAIWQPIDSEEKVSLTIPLITETEQTFDSIGLYKIDIIEENYTFTKVVGDWENNIFHADIDSYGCFVLGYDNVLDSITTMSLTNGMLMGDGSENNPYLIYSEEDFEFVRNNRGSGVYYKLMADIDLANITWKPLGTNGIGNTFSANFNGNGHKLYNLFSISSAYSNCGIFGYAENAKIENLGIVVQEGKQISSPNSGGIMMNIGKNCIVNNCYIIGDYITTSKNAGSAGLLANSYSGAISNCYVQGCVSVYGNYALGYGVTGYAGGMVSEGNATIKDCICFAEVRCNNKSSDCYSGGISCKGNTNIQNCLFIGETRKGNEKSTGQIYGILNSKAATVVNCYYSKSNSMNCSMEKWGTGKSIDELRTIGTYVGWDFENIWTMDDTDNAGFPMLKTMINTSHPTSKYLLPTPIDYSKRSKQVILSNSFEFTVLFDRAIKAIQNQGVYLKDTTSGEKIACSYLVEDSELHIETLAEMKNGAKYTLVISENCLFDANYTENYYGGQTNQFFVSVTKPYFEGDGSVDNPYVIENVEQLNCVYYQPAMNYILGSDIDASSVNSITSIGGCKDTSGTIGVYAHYDTETQGEKAAFSGEFDGNGHTISGIKRFSGQSPTGDYYRKNIGLFASVNGGTIKNLTVSMADDCYLYNERGGTIVDIFRYPYISILVAEGNGVLSNCTIHGTIYSNQSTDYAGLLAASFGGTIDNCAADGSVKKEGNKAVIGGLVGKLTTTGSINNSYAFATVSGTNGGTAGGLVGSNDGSVNKCYSVGNVVNTTNMGGLVGGGSGNVKESYYDSDKYTLEDNGFGIAKSSSDLKDVNTYSTWDFNKTWCIVPTINQGYPYLLVNMYDNNVKFYNSIESNIELINSYAMKVPFGSDYNLVDSLLTKNAYVSIAGIMEVSEQSDITIEWSFDKTKFNSRPESGDYSFYVYGNPSFVNSEYQDQYSSYLPQFSCKITVQGDPYQYLYDRYNMRVQDLFSLYPEYLANEPSDMLIAKCCNICCEAMEVHSDIEIGVAAVLKALKDGTTIIVNEVLANHVVSDVDDLSQEKQAEALLSLMEIYCDTEISTSSSLMTMNIWLGNAAARYGYAGTEEEIIENMANSIDFAHTVVNNDGGKLAKAISSLGGKLKKDAAIPKISNTTFKALSDIDKHITFINTIVGLYNIDYVSYEEIINALNDSGITQSSLLDAANHKLEYMRNCPELYVTMNYYKDDLIDLVIDEGLKTLATFTNTRIGSISSCAIIVQASIGVISSFYEIVNPGFDELALTFISYNYHIDSGNAVDRYQREFRLDKIQGVSITQKDMDNYRVAYNLMLASIKLWMNSAEDSLGLFGNERLKNKFDLYRDTILGEEGLTYEKYLDNCMSAVATSSGEERIEIPLITQKTIENNTIEITISHSDPDVSIYYTLDSSIPLRQNGMSYDTISQRYTSTFVVNSDSIIKARAFKSGCISSEVATCVVSTDIFWDGIYEEMCSKHDLTTVIEAGSHYWVPQKIFELIKEKNIDLTIAFDNYTWNISSDSITKETNISLKIFSLTEKDLSKMNYSSNIDLKKYNCKGIRLEYDGQFGLEGDLKYYYGKQYSGQYVQLIYYNLVTEEYEDTYQRSLVDKNGYVSFKFVHASSYLLISEKVENNTHTSDAGQGSVTSSDLNEYNNDNVETNIKGNNITSNIQNKSPFISTPNSNMDNEGNAYSMTDNQNKDNSNNMLQAELKQEIAGENDNTVQKEKMDSVLNESDTFPTDLEKGYTPSEDNGSDDKKEYAKYFVLVCILLFGIVALKIKQNNRKL